MTGANQPPASRHNAPAPVIITSPQNPKVKQARELRNTNRRRREKRMLVEGAKHIMQALTAEVCPRQCFYVPERLHEYDHKVLIEMESRGAELIATTARVLETLADTESPQPLIAVMEHPAEQGPATFREGGLVLIADQLKDPGNAGVLLRTAAAAGAAVVMTGGAVDITNPKVFRASAGLLFSVPLWTGAEVPEVTEAARRAGYRLLLCDSRGAKPYYVVDMKPATAIIIGSEAHGPSHLWSEAADEVVHIPMAGEAESLNASVAAAVVLYEALRQRRQATTC